MKNRDGQRRNKGQSRKATEPQQGAHLSQQIGKLLGKNVVTNVGGVQEQETRPRQVMSKLYATQRGRAPDVK